MSNYPRCPTIQSNQKKWTLRFSEMITELRCQKEGAIAFVIVAPSFVPHLKGLGSIVDKSISVHDDHIHVEFVSKCRLEYLT